MPRVRRVYLAFCVRIARVLARLLRPVVQLREGEATTVLLMFLYSFLLIVLNRNALPAAIRPTSFRVATLAWSTMFFGVLSALTIWQQRETVMRSVNGLLG